MTEIVERPWGSFNQLYSTEKSWIKILKVKPNQRLSLQYHNHRDETWYMMTDGSVQIGDKVNNYKRGAILEIRRNTPHRLISSGNEVEVLEIASGNPVDENDVVRLKDDYGRAN